MSKLLGSWRRENLVLRFTSCYNYSCSITLWYLSHCRLSWTTNCYRKCSCFYFRRQGLEDSSFDVLRLAIKYRSFNLILVAFPFGSRIAMHKFKRNIPINALACMLHDSSSKEGQTLMKSRIILEAELKRVDYSVLTCFQVRFVSFCVCWRQM